MPRARRRRCGAREASAADDAAGGGEEAEAESFWFPAAVLPVRASMAVQARSSQFSRSVLGRALGTPLCRSSSALDPCAARWSWVRAGCADLQLLAVWGALVSAAGWYAVRHGIQIVI